jgi:hypothetical protein
MDKPYIVIIKFTLFLLYFSNCILIEMLKFHNKIYIYNFIKEKFKII